VKKIIFLAVFVFVVFGIFSESDKKTAKYNFKIATDAPDGSSWVTLFKDMDKELRKKTNGEVGLTIYPSGLMGDGSSVIKKIKMGQLSGGALASSGLEMIYKEFASMAFPMVFRTVDEYDFVKEKIAPFYEAELEKKDFIMLSWTEVGFIYVFSKKKINSVQTLKDSKPFLIEGDIVSKAIFEEINAKPVPIQMADILTGLQTGTIDTIFSSTYGVIVTQWHTRVNYMADFPITFMYGGLVVEKKLFNSMPKEYQILMKKLFTESFNKLSVKIRKDNANARNSIEKRGMVFLPVDKKEQAKFEEICKKARDKLTEKEYSSDVLAKILKYTEEYRNKK